MEYPEEIWLNVDHLTRRSCLGKYYLLPQGIPWNNRVASRLPEHLQEEDSLEQALAQPYHTSSSSATQSAPTTLTVKLIGASTTPFTCASSTVRVRATSWITSLICLTPFLTTSCVAKTDEHPSKRICPDSLISTENTNKYNSNVPAPDWSRSEQIVKWMMNWNDRLGNINWSELCSLYFERLWMWSSDFQEPM